MKILVDADACPRTVLRICRRVGSEHRVQVWTVASFNHNIDSDHHVVVGNAPQAADLKILNLAGEGDIIVTQDMGLAAMVMGKGARSLSPTGKQYRPETIDFLLEVREAKARHRRAGGKTGGPKKRTTDDDTRFEDCLRGLLTSE